MVEYYFLSMITDFRLKVFETVARRLNFTRAAEELFIRRPAATRKACARWPIPAASSRNTKRWLKKYPLAAIPLFPAN